MIEKSFISTFYTLAPTHPGTGQSTGAIDLPIQREVHTKFPFIQSSSIKGSLRSLAKNKGCKDDDIEIIFGPEDGNKGSGNLIVGDARILAFPVRSLQRVFVWITCPLVLQRLKVDFELSGNTQRWTVPENPNKAKLFCFSENRFEGPLVLEELSFEVEPLSKSQDLKDFLRSAIPANISLPDKWPEDVVILNDDEFCYLVSSATTVTARNILHDTKKTSKNLWYEETIPPDTIFSIIFGQVTRAPNINGKEISVWIRDFLEKEPYIQFGGNETIGQGWCKLHILDKEKKNE